MQTKRNTRERNREKIKTNCGDIESLLGTTSDSVHLLLYVVSQMTVALNTANSLAEVRAAAAPFKDVAEAFVNKVTAEEVKLPYQAKAFDTIMAEIEARATAVTEVLTVRSK